VGWADQGLHGASSQIQQSSIYEYEEYGSRIFWIGDWDGPNVLALVFLFAIPFCLENIFKVSNRKFKRLLYLTTLILLTLGLKLTNSRGGYIAFICILAVFILMRFKIKYWPVVIVPLLLLIFIFSPKRMAIMDTGESSAHERTWLWEQGLNLGRENPVFGIGKGRFGQYAEKIAHSNYITNFAEIGYFGLFIFVALLYFSLKNAYLVYKLARKNDLELSSLSRIILITTIGFYIATFFVSMELDILYVILALCSGLTFFIKEQDRKFTRTISAVDIVSIIIINFVIILGYWLIAEKHII
jgi:O-antigen ligase